MIMIVGLPKNSFASIRLGFLTEKCLQSNHDYTQITITRISNPIKPSFFCYNRLAMPLDHSMLLQVDDSVIIGIFIFLTLMEYSDSKIDWIFKENI